MTSLPHQGTMLRTLALALIGLSSTLLTLAPYPPTAQFHAERAIRPQ